MGSKKRRQQRNQRDGRGGGGGGNKQNKKNFQRGGGKVGEGYDLGRRDNDLFVKYYKGLGIVPEEEWDDFYATLQKTLPVTFRITSYKSQSEELLKNIEGKFLNNLLDVKVDGEEVPPPKNLPWYPSKLAWQLDLTRKTVRSNEDLSRLHDFLVAETECGAISRQEAVSMIPPIVLDVQSHHKVLDLCAAPGSKTAQLIEYLHSTCPEGQQPSGFVIANDTDNKRCYLMVHQVKRLQSPNCVIVNHDGTQFPKIRTNEDTKNPEYLLFDRVLCDVPCSGDGTMRKNFDIWNKWHPLLGANLHGLQLKLLRRGCQLLEKNGRIVYSTCSLNPIEDEAVIAELLRGAQGSMELVDIRHLLPGLKFSTGLTNWRVMTKTGEWINSASEIPAPLQTQFKHTVFPPTAEEAAQFHLDRCIRILPHQQDTGGFFIAALQKVKHLPSSREARMEQESASLATQEEGSAKPEKDTATDDTAATTLPEASQGKRKGPENNSGVEAKRRKLHGYKEDPFLFMEETDPIWPSIRDFFGLPQTFPVDQILFRSLQGKRTLYFVSQAVREITRYNDGRIKFINMGVKAFSRSPSPIVPDCDFRITQEVLGTLLADVSKRRVAVSKSDAVIVISQENPFIGKLSEQTQNLLQAMSPGSAVFVFSPSEKEPSPNCEVVFCGWRGKNSVRCFGSRCDRSHALMLLGEDIKEINKRVEEEKKLKKEARQENETNKEDEVPEEDEMKEAGIIENEDILDDEETKADTIIDKEEDILDGEETKADSIIDKGDILDKEEKTEDSIIDREDILDEKETKADSIIDKEILDDETKIDSVNDGDNENNTVNTEEG